MTGTRTCRPVLVLIAWVGSLQIIPQRLLPPSNQEVPAEFTRLTSIRELPDGRCLVVDAGDALVWMIDFDKGTADVVGRRGSGPGEYRQPAKLLAYRGDSTLLVDIGLQRSIIFGPSGLPGDVFPPGRLVSQLSAGTGIPTAADAHGRIYFQGSLTTLRGPESDSVPIWRVQLEPLDVDTLAWVALSRPDVRMQGRGGAISELQVPRGSLAASDAWGVLPDGRTVVVRVRDYRLEVFTDHQRTASGRPIPFTPLRVEEQDRNAASEWARSSLPKWKPPFLGAALMVASNQRLWVRRTTTATDSITHYDVLNLEGVVVAKVSSPPHTRIVGFGKRVLYMVRRDSVDVEHVGRIALPTW